MKLNILGIDYSFLESFFTNVLLKFINDLDYVSVILSFLLSLLKIEFLLKLKGWNIELLSSFLNSFCPKINDWELSFSLESSPLIKIPEENGFGNIYFSSFFSGINILFFY